MGQSAMIRFERRDALEVEALVLEFLALVLEEVEPARAVLFGGAQRRDLALEFAGARDLSRHDLPQRRLAREGIQRDRVHLGAAQGLRAVLARDLELAAEDVREGRDRNQLAADASPTPSLGRERPAHDQLGGGSVFLGFERESALGQRAGHVLVPVHSEERLDGALFRAASKRVLGGPPAREQRQRAQHDRLARSGLPGQHVEAGPELELDGLDERQILDPQQFDHGVPTHPASVGRMIPLRAAGLKRERQEPGGVSASIGTWPPTRPSTCFRNAPSGASNHTLRSPNACAPGASTISSATRSCWHRVDRCIR